MAVQKNARTVGGELVGAIRRIDPGASSLRAASRTDAGVHARDQVAAFDTSRELPPRGWVLGITRSLPREIAVVNASVAPAGFDPRRHVVAKVYRYLVLRSPVRDPLLEGRAWRVVERLNLSAMRRAAASLVGRNDFAAFHSSDDDRSDTVRTIVRADVVESLEDPRVAALVVEGDRFLHRMVRIIAGTLVDVGRDRCDGDAIGRALRSGRRGDLGVTAPAHGLCLDRIELDVTLPETWPERDDETA